MSKQKLVYFASPGRAAAIRLAAHVGGLDFEDERIQHPEFVTRKEAGEFPLGSVPVWEVNGQVFAQSQAILRYVGKLTGLYPTDPLEALYVDQVLDTIAEVIDLLGPSFREQDQDKKLAMRKDLVDNKAPKFLAALNKWSASGHIVGGKITIADINLFGLYGAFTSGILDGIDVAWLPTNYPNIAKLGESVKSNPKVAEALAASKHGVVPAPAPKP